jgi:hypothetical protein
VPARSSTTVASVSPHRMPVGRRHRPGLIGTHHEPGPAAGAHLRPGYG